jgi:hypothetical protein
LPDGKTWRIDDHRTSWLLASHAPSSSSLGVRVFLEDDAINAARCEEHARRDSPSLPLPASGRVISWAVPRALEGWDTRAMLLLVPRNQAGQPLDLEGHLLLFSARVRKCMVLHYATRALGPGADEVIGARLAEVEELVRRVEPLDELQGPPAEPPPFAR